MSGFDNGDCPSNVKFQRKPISNRTLIMNIDESDIQNPEESSFVQKYKQICQKLEATDAPRYEQQLRNLEETEIFKSLVEREMEKLRIQRTMEGRLALEAWKENDRKKVQENINRGQQQREKTLPKQEQLSQIEKPIQEKTTDNKNEDNSRGFSAVFSSILFSILGLFEFYLIYGVVSLITALLFIVMSNIPLVSTLVEWLFRFRGDSPDMFATLFGATIAFVGTMATLAHIKESTQKLAVMIMGVSLVALNIFFLIVNLVFHEAIFVNIIMSIAGIIIFVKGKNT